MSIKINFGAFNQVFAVPSALVDSHLKLATESQLKVLLYILRLGSDNITAEDISKAVGVHISEVENALSFWDDRGLVSTDTQEQNIKINTNNEVEDASVISAQNDDAPKKVTLTSRLQRPDISFVASRLSTDKELTDLMNDIEFALGKFLSAGDKATVVMIKETLGLPCEVIILLVNYCVSRGKGNMRAIERMAANWSDRGIFTMEQADQMISHLDMSNNAWQKVSKIFGIKNIGLPTDAQLSYADTWCNEWKFSDEMLLEAYTRCVNSKGEYSIRYINGILKKWYADKIFNLDDLMISDSKKKSKKKSSDRNASYDIETFESKSLFND